MADRICRPVISVPTVATVTDNAVIRFIAIPSDGMMILCSMMRYPGVIVLVSGKNVRWAKERAFPVWSVLGTCTLPTDNPEAHGAASLLVTRSSSMGATTHGGPSFLLIVVGLLGAAMMAMKVARQQRRHRGLLRRHQYNEVDNTATSIGI